MFLFSFIVAASFIFSVFTVTFSFNQANELKLADNNVIVSEANATEARNEIAPNNNIPGIIDAGKAPDALTTSLIPLPIKPAVPASIGEGKIEQEEATKNNAEKIVKFLADPDALSIKNLVSKDENKKEEGIFNDVLSMVKKTVKTQPKNNDINSTVKAETDKEVEEMENEEPLPKEVLAKNYPLKNYKNQYLPSEIYKREYDDKNSHLPRAVYKEDMKNVMLAATQKGNLTGMRAMLDSGSNPNGRVRTGDTYLIHSIMNGQTSAARLLLARGANPNSKGEWGQTALHIAAFTGDKDMTQLLLEMNADPTIKNDVGETPYKIAKEQGNIEVANLIIRKNQEIFRENIAKEADRVKAERDNSRLENERFFEDKRMLAEVARIKKEREEARIREIAEAPIREAARLAEIKRQEEEAIIAEEKRIEEEKKAKIAAAEAKIAEEKKKEEEAIAKKIEFEKSIIEARKAKRKRTRFQLAIPETILPDWKEAVIPLELQTQNNTELPEELLQQKQ